MNCSPVRTTASWWGRHWLDLAALRGGATATSRTTTGPTPFALPRLCHPGAQCGPALRRVCPLADCRRRTCAGQGRGLEGDRLPRRRHARDAESPRIRPRRNATSEPRRHGGDHRHLDARAGPWAAPGATITQVRSHPDERLLPAHLHLPRPRCAATIRWISNPRRPKPRAKPMSVSMPGWSRIWRSSKAHTIARRTSRRGLLGNPRSSRRALGGVRFSLSATAARLGQQARRP